MRPLRATHLCAIALFAAAIVPLSSAAGCGSNRAAAPGAAPNAWASHALWDDGQAEVNAYDAVEIRYGQPRSYTDYQITVKEPFSRRLLVKADPGHDPADVFQVLKLNRVLRYQTGVYSYNQMLSVFFDPADMQPAKWTLAHFEWCGNTFKEFTRRDGAARLETRTYWDGDADQSYELEFGAGTVFYDQLPVWLRSQPLSPGTRKVKIYPSEIFSKGPRPKPVEASITAAVAEQIATAGGSSRRAVPIAVELAGGTHRFWFDPDFPHVLLGWERPDGGRGRLRWSKRIKYWELHDPGDERHLES